MSINVNNSTPSRYNLQIQAYQGSAKSGLPRMPCKYQAAQNDEISADGEVGLFLCYGHNDRKIQIHIGIDS